METIILILSVSLSVIAFIAGLIDHRKISGGDLKINPPEDLGRAWAETQWKKWK